MKTDEDRGNMGTTNNSLIEQRNPAILEEFPAYDSIQHGDLINLSLSANTRNLTHGLHRFPAKYIPQVPRWALREFSNLNSIVLDPFMGSGTTLVEGVCRVNKTIGLDIDPLSRLISKAKTTVYCIDRLNKLAIELLDTSERTETELFLPMSGVDNIEHWFTKDAWFSLCSIYSAIMALTCTEEERTFFLCVFSSILRWVSNADDQTQKTYVSGTLIKNPPLVRQTFHKALVKAISSVEELAIERGSNEATIINGSALQIPITDRTVDLIITSPPYLDSVDYMYNFMLEYFWLGPTLGVQSRAEFNRLRRIPVGTKKPASEIGQLPGKLNNLIDLSSIPQYRQSAVNTYFNSMSKHFREAARVLKNNGKYVLVIGNSQSSEGIIPVHDCLVELAKDEGLYLEKAFAYRIRRHYMRFPRKGRGGIILMDWIITLGKAGGPIASSDERLPIPDVTLGDDEVAN